MAALHSEKKMMHFKKYWGTFLQGKVLSLLETKMIFFISFKFYMLTMTHALNVMQFKKRYKCLQSSSSDSQPTPTS